jgi:hypothetical protein
MMKIGFLQESSALGILSAVLVSDTTHVPVLSELL